MAWLSRASPFFRPGHAHVHQRPPAEAVGKCPAPLLRKLSVNGLSPDEATNRAGELRHRCLCPEPHGSDEAEAKRGLTVRGCQEPKGCAEGPRQYVFAAPCRCFMVGSERRRSHIARHDRGQALYHSVWSAILRIRGQKCRETGNGSTQHFCMHLAGRTVPTQ